MATIREQQLENLQNTNAENISFYVYDKDGVAKSQLVQSKDVLKTVPAVLQPINQNLSIEYLRPLKDVIKNSSTKDIQLVNKNPNFRYSTFNWNINSTLASVIQPNKLYLGVNPVSGISCLEQNQVNDVEDKSNHLIKNILSESPIVNGRDIEISFHYYAQSFLTFPGVSHKFYLSVGVDTTANGTVDKMINFEANKFETGTFTNDEYYKRIEITEFNKWVKYTTTINFANFDTDQVNLEVKLFRASASNSGTLALSSISKVFIDAFYITQKKSVNKLIHKKTKGSIFSFEGADVLISENTGEYKQKDTIHSNEFDTRDINSISGTYARRDRIETFNKTLDKIILQEILNDYRSSVKRYEGEFYKNDSTELPIHFYNKIWVNYGINVLQDPVAAVIDSMEFDVKANVYRITMHLPNQNDDDLTYDTFRYE